MKKLKVFNKLVRDNIPEIIESKGEKVIIETLSTEDYKTALLEKLIEEAQELKQNPSMEEVADVLEVLESICESFSFTEDEVQRVKAEKQKIRGGFKNKVFLKETYEE